MTYPKSDISGYDHKTLRSHAGLRVMYAPGKWIRGFRAMGGLLGKYQTSQA